MKCRLDVTNNNVFMTVINEQGEVMYKVSGGTVGMKGPRKRTSYASELVGKKVGEWCLSMDKRTIRLEVNGYISKNVRSAVTGLVLLGVKITQIILLTRVAHNGVRKRKLRRK